MNKEDTMNKEDVFTSEKTTADLDSDDKALRAKLKLQWNQIDWNKVNETVNRMQTRIAKASKDGNKKLIKDLQRMVVNSYHAKVLAVKIVTSNEGKKTPGIDGVLWTTDDVKMENALRLNVGEYKAKPLKRVDIDKGKGDGSTRPLGIPTMYDRAMQCLYSFALDPVAESLGDNTSYGFRKARSTKDAGEQIYACLAAGNTAQWILDADIKGFFDNISHEWLLNNIPMDKKILNQFLKSGVVIKGKLHPTTKGTPQGGIISPILANMALDGMESLIKDNFWKYDNRTKRFMPNRKANYRGNLRKVNFIRYADDFIVTGDTKETCEEVKQLLTPFLDERGVKFADNKTVIRHIDEGFDFLGWNFRKYKGKLLVKPSKKSIGKFLDEIRDIIKKNATTSQQMLIYQLNPKIRGWRNYHKHVVARDAFEYVDHKIFEALWSWAIRRHKKKGKRWVKDRYWHHMGGDSWIFYDNSEKFSHKNQRLIKCSNQKIIRHPMLDTKKNPYIDKDYFTQRNFTLGSRNLSGNFKKIWIRQKGICPVCLQSMRFADNDDRVVHHNTPKAWGGSDNPSNLFYMHDQCHIDYHVKNTVRRNPNKEIINNYNPISDNKEWKTLYYQYN